jgi:hypothetical protein
MEPDNFFAAYESKSTKSTGSASQLILPSHALPAPH